ncbi:hypothetical protein BDV12DRAFT_202342 [Aspergillus spectabilis]
MSMPSGVSIPEECLLASTALYTERGPKKPRFLIFAISDDERTVALEESSTDPDYEKFRERLAKTSAPRFATYDVEYDLGEDGKRSRIVFISWVPENTPVKLRMLYASTKEQFRNALNVKLSVHADIPDEIEWRNILSVASRGRL